MSQLNDLIGKFFDVDPGRCYEVFNDSLRKHIINCSQNNTGLERAKRIAKRKHEKTGHTYHVYRVVGRNSRLVFRCPDEYDCIHS